ncbi:tRNA lysidine(34) synthetase TilS [Brucella sp. 10RB9214]|uniref:tRNA lysidine(34) synthetase TilS n=1 Tax=unclassified Brucella TaxID=2632610 RepID=UPI00097277A5|nr:tRNA lysidine(34) synthetase TilS [Brucella sp. 09RB8910]APY14181.1 tRNA lysidine(34) synthetase TilS [Brucella sp. 09RB8910]MRN46904.1 tRNA lysidine(34) synthetase TilS [Brucella sp. 10RB9212]MRN49305.1 tRNA lysidine(34) synthetase TilS [Brucella sp. 10RB9214]
MGLSPVNIFKPFGLGRAKAVIAAVSGGSDSLGLLFLLKDYLSTLESPPVLIAVTVDHKLRAESALEAENVGLLCQKHGIMHRVLSWDDPKPAHGLAAAARTARYRLLVQAARDAGAGFIVTGHTENDQIETFLMRKARSGHCEARGLAAMSPRSLLEGSVELARPLLTVSRQALREELTRRGIAWVDDPSNANTDYERPRVRLGVAAEADGQEVLEQIAQAGAARERDNAALVEALADPATLGVDAAGMMFLDADCYAALSPGARQLFSGLLASIAGGRRFLPGDGERRRIERMLSGQDAPRRLTVFGALIERGEKGAPHRFRRERRNLPKLDLVPGQHIVWDGRFCFFNSGGRSFEIAPPGRQELIDFLKNSGRDMESRRCEALLISPALYEGGKLAFVPFLPGADWPQGVHIERHFAIFDHVLPGHDFALAQAVETRLGRACAEIS